MEKIELADLSRKECNDLLLRKGFYKKSSANEEVPEKYKNGPYKAINEDL